MPNISLIDLKKYDGKLTKYMKILKILVQATRRLAGGGVKKKTHSFVSRLVPRATQSPVNWVPGFPNVKTLERRASHPASP